MTHTCRECGMRHDRPRYQAAPTGETPIDWPQTLRSLGCGILLLGALVVLLWTFFLLWPK